MKRYINFKTALFALAAIMLTATASRAAVDMFLTFKDAKGKETKVGVSKDGTYKTPPMSAGTYSWSFGVGRGISSPTGGSADRMNNIASISVSHEIVAPRDHASGMATGKRMHKPFVITKELDRSSPQLMTANLGSLVVDVDCDGITGKVDGKDKAGNVIPMGWDLKSNTK